MMMATLIGGVAAVQDALPLWLSIRFYKSDSRVSSFLTNLLPAIFNFPASWKLPWGKAFAISVPNLWGCPGARLLR